MLRHVHPDQVEGDWGLAPLIPKITAFWAPVQLVVLLSIYPHSRVMSEGPEKREPRAIATDPNWLCLGKPSSVNQPTAGEW